MRVPARGLPYGAGHGAPHLVTPRRRTLGTIARSGACPALFQEFSMPRRPLVPNGLAALALVSAAAIAPAWASSSASSASSEGISASVGSVSTSIEGSSNSSSPAGKTAEGPYRVIHVAAADKPGFVRVALAAEAGDHRFALLLPATNPEASLLATGDVVVATAREYGTQFARAGAAEPFFLVVEDQRLPELKTRPVAG